MLLTPVELLRTLVETMKLIFLLIKLLNLLKIVNIYGVLKNKNKLKKILWKYKQLLIMNKLTMIY
jgi:hypothetical protein